LCWKETGTYVELPECFFSFLDGLFLKFSISIVLT